MSKICFSGQGSPFFFFPSDSQFFLIQKKKEKEKCYQETSNINEKFLLI